LNDGRNLNSFVRIATVVFIRYLKTGGFLSVVLALLIGCVINKKSKSLDKNQNPCNSNSPVRKQNIYIVPKRPAVAGFFDASAHIFQKRGTIDVFRGKYSF
ncbi:MAG: hypothetical protein LLF87_12495, partial [Eubacteriales bacterium]|nr:hypothetical protein [Eubacteriales bacterium]